MNKKRFKRYLLIFTILYLLQTVAIYLLIYLFSLSQVKSSLQTIVSRVKEDISYKNGVWDTTKYNADPEIPGRFRLYVFSKDGFVIERWRPIPGYLDTSDFNRLLTYKIPQTVHTITDQDWRIYSKPIVDKNNNKIAVITVSSFNPTVMTLSELDNQLQKTADTIHNKIVMKDGTIHVEKLDIRSLPFSIPFQVVDNYNTILIKNNNVSSMDRIPNFIDPSYVRLAIQDHSYLQLNNLNGRGNYLSLSAPLIDKDGKIFGLVVAARVTSEIDDLLKAFLIGDVIIGGIFITIFGLLISRFPHEESQFQLKRLSIDEIKNITFIKDECSLQINEFKIVFSYATNQYYMCLTLFSNPKKKWETDELIEKFGVENKKQNWRKVYDAMAAINTKTSNITAEKLIICSNKTYRINPIFVSRITKI